MKKVLFHLVFIFLIFFGVTSCENESQDNLPNKEAYSEINNLNGKWYIYYCEWDEWGRSSRDCLGWGLCNYYDCWDCNINDKIWKHKGKVIFDDITRQGFLIIELDILDDIQKIAIENQEIFTIDEEINNPNSILHKGQYQFDSSVGIHGGYKINITVK